MPTNYGIVAASFGFIEHFQDSDAVIGKHLEMVKPGGFVVLFIPNHSSVRGELFKRLSPSAYEIHNCMSYEDILASLAADRRQ